jgi:hypothetical protein
MMWSAERFSARTGHTGASGEGADLEACVFHVDSIADLCTFSSPAEVPAQAPDEHGHM